MLCVKYNQNKGLVINYRGGGGSGYTMGKSWVQNFLHPTLKIG